MDSRSSLRLRIVVDFVLVCALGFALPTVLAPIGRNWPTLLVAFAAMLLTLAFLLDALRTFQRFRKLRSS